MSEKPGGKAAGHGCPYCEGEVQEAGNPFCKPCGVTLRHCPKCDTFTKREAAVCPECGGDLEWK
jgi:hypothetical protein